MQSTGVDYQNIWVAMYEGRHVGHYAGIPVDAWVRGVRTPAIAPVDAMVDPQLRRRGILTALVTRAHEHWRRAGVCFCFGLPNEQYDAAALGWVPLFPFRWHRRILRPEAVAARVSGVNLLVRLTLVGAISRRLLRRAQTDPQISTQEIFGTHRDLDIIADSSRRVDCVHFIRGSDWVNRRYLSCPSSEYHVHLAKRDDDPVGYAVYGLRGTTVVTATITEVVSRLDDSLVYPTLVAAVEKRCLDACVETISTLSIPGSESCRQLKRCGFIPRRAAFELQYVPLQLGMTALTSIEEWHIEGGDFDVV